MSFEVTIGPGFNDAVTRQMIPIIEADLSETRAIIVEEFNAPKTGREYRSPRGGRYTASAAGEPPAIRSGNLRDSISEPDVRREGGAVVGRITIAEDYAILLERGAPRLAPRPFARPAIEELLRRRA